MTESPFPPDALKQCEAMVADHLEDGSFTEDRCDVIGDIRMDIEADGWSSHGWYCPHHAAEAAQDFADWYEDNYLSDPVVIKGPTIKDEVIAALMDADRPVTRNELAERLPHIKPGSIGAYLSIMASDGKARHTPGKRLDGARVSAGTYEWIDAP